MFADDKSLNASDKSTATVHNVLQKSKNELSDWRYQNALILHSAKPKCMLHATRLKQHQFRPLIRNLSLKNIHIHQV